MPSAPPDFPVPPVAVTATFAGLQDRAKELALELGLPLLTDAPGEDYYALLELTEAGLSCRPLGESASGPISVEFDSGGIRHRRRGGHNEPLGRAVGVGKRDGLWVVDATAGLGRDSFVLADLGCRMTLLEQSPVVFALLRDGLVRAGESDDEWVRQVVGRMCLQHAEARQWLELAPDCPDVVYLDPMFPERKKSARVKKEMWLFHRLIGLDADEVGLLQAALAAATWRVVVKRPARAPFLAGSDPHHSIPGKTVRFDVYNADVVG